jgi:glycerol-3-phosphate dehydrogenase
LLGATAQAIDRLVLHHGSIAERLLARAVAEGSGFLPASEVLAVEIDHAVDSEMAVRLVDVLERRLRLLLFDPARGLDVADAVAKRMAGRLRWSETRREREIEDYRRVAASCVPVSEASMRSAAT